MNVSATANKHRHERTALRRQTSTGTNERLCDGKQAQARTNSSATANVETRTVMTGRAGVSHQLKESGFEMVRQDGHSPSIKRNEFWDGTPGRTFAIN
jgi:hypothetical protein